jgi:hypothetical protein
MAQRLPYDCLGKTISTFLANPIKIKKENGPKEFGYE